MPIQEINAQEINGYTALTLAVLKKDENSIELLLNKPNLGVNITNKWAKPL